ncbi:MAG: glycogen synthase GlgA [Planctomycetota bacterium]|nr:MAG: glycogen synthase GlgA [Planctomycetota bacterium]
MDSYRGLRVLHVAGEAVPMVKTGGLADVVGALPVALNGLGVDARVAIPGYRHALRVAEEMGMRWLPGNLTIEAGGMDHSLGVAEVMVSGVPVYLLACEELFARDGVYGPTPASDYEDNARRYAVFAKAALALPGFLTWVPHVVHAHDWQAGLVPALLQRGWGRSLPATRSLFTIHNIAYQGTFWHWDMKLTGLNWSLYNPLQLEHFGKLNFLKAGVVFADRVTTVSQRYAQEIQGEDFGYGLDGVITSHAYKLSGITNGIDHEIWDPSTDPHLPAHYSHRDLSGKRICKQHLQREVGLPEDPNIAVVGVVSRLVEQKGIDFILDAVDPYILAGRMQLVVLGAGEPHLEAQLRNLQGRHADRVCFWHGYNEGLAHRIEAGSDLFLMPSRFEPCGLNQMYSLRYGTLPLVRYTGGLADTVIDVASGEGNGFTFGPMDMGHFSAVLDRALGLYQYFPKEWQRAQRRAMQADHSWARVAMDYAECYREMTWVER